MTPFDGVVLREALLREHFRGGQSFFVVPRIADLPDMEEWIRAQVPEAKFVTAHGQMEPRQVEERMSAFYDRKYDVLPVDDDRRKRARYPNREYPGRLSRGPLGLAQLYSCAAASGERRPGLCLSTMPATRAITEAAQKRLEVLVDLDNLGAGFQLASHDLGIRGAGNLLGDEQSGHIKEVGFELYQSMLE